MEFEAVLDAQGFDDGLPGVAGDQHLAARGQALDAGREIDGAAHRAELGALFRADVADYDLSGVHPDAQLDPRQAPRGETVSDLVHLLLHLKRALDGGPGVVVPRQGCAEEHENGVAQELVDGAPGLDDHVGHRRQVLIEERHHLLRLQALGVGAEPPEVGHQHRNDPSLAPQSQPEGAGEQALHHLVGQVAAEDLAQKAAAELEPLGQQLRLAGQPTEG